MADGTPAIHQRVAQDLYLGSRFRWNDWVLEVSSYLENGDLRCRIVEGPRHPCGVLWDFHPDVPIRHLITSR